MLLNLDVATPFALLVLACWVALVTPRLAATDIAEHRLPNSIVMPGWLAMFAAFGVAWLEAGTYPAAVIGASFIALGAGLVVGLSGAVGMGDVKLAIPLVAALALAHPGKILGWGVVVIFGTGALALVHLVRTRQMDARIPLGPMLLGGFWVMYLA